MKEEYYIVVVDSGDYIEAFRMTEAEMMQLPETGNGAEINIYHEATLTTATAEEIVKRFDLGKGEF